MALGSPDAPYEATEWLRCRFRSMCLQIKCAAARNEEANVIVRMWYMDHLVVARNMMYSRLVQSAAAASTLALPAPPRPFYSIS